MVKDRHIDRDALVARKPLVVTAGMLGLNIVRRSDVQALLDGDILIQAPTLAIGGTTTQVAVGEVIYQINGQRYRIAAGDVAFTATTHDIADPDANPKEAIYVFSANEAGTVTITKGTDAEADAAVAPATPAGHVKFGEVKIQHDGSAIFDATTDALDAAKLTVTYTPATAFALTSGVVTDSKKFSFTPGYPFVVESVRHYFEDITAAFSYDIEIAGTTILQSAAVPADATEAAASLVASETARKGTASQAIEVDVTLDATGAARDGYIVIEYRPYFLKGDPPQYL